MTFTSSTKSQTQWTGLDDNDFADLRPSPRLRQQFPDPRGLLAKEQPFPFAAGPFATTNETRGQDLGIIEDKKIAGRKEIGEIAKMAVIQSTSRAIDHEQA